MNRTHIDRPELELFHLSAELVNLKLHQVYDFEKESAAALANSSPIIRRVVEGPLQDHFAGLVSELGTAVLKMDPNKITVEYQAAVGEHTAKTVGAQQKLYSYADALTKLVPFAANEILNATESPYVKRIIGVQEEVVRGSASVGQDYIDRLQAADLAIDIPVKSVKVERALYEFFEKHDMNILPSGKEMLSPAKIDRYLTTQGMNARIGEYLMAFVGYPITIAMLADVAIPEKKRTQLGRTQKQNQNIVAGVVEARSVAGGKLHKILDDKGLVVQRGTYSVPGQKPEPIIRSLNLDNIRNRPELYVGSEYYGASAIKWHQLNKNKLVAGNA